MLSRPEGSGWQWLIWSSQTMVLVLAIAFTGLVGVLHIDAAGGVGLDVLVLHEQAANAIESGSNPYTEAVSVPDGAPTAEPGDVITGYVYPPITALFYSLGEWTFADPRYTSLMSWLVFLGVLGFQATKTRSVAPLLALLLMASIPGWPLVLRAAWTEPLSLAMAALAFQYWERASVSGVFLGMTLGSKQYFVVTAPILALYRDFGWARRAMWAVAIVGGTVGLALALDFGAFWSSAIAFHLSTPPRPDSLNLVGLFAATGLDVEFPSVLPVVVGLVASIVVGRWARNRVQFFSGLAFTLAASFVFSSQAFPNYWFLTAGLCGIVMVSAYSPTVADKSSSDALSARGHSDG